MRTLVLARSATRCGKHTAVKSEHVRHAISKSREILGGRREDRRTSGATLKTKQPTIQQVRHASQHPARQANATEHVAASGG
jgi:hypothetical protein